MVYKCFMIYRKLSSFIFYIRGIQKFILLTKKKVENKQIINDLFFQFLVNFTLKKMFINILNFSVVFGLLDSII